VFYSFGIHRRRPHLNLADALPLATLNLPPHDLGEISNEPITPMEPPLEWNKILVDGTILAPTRGGTTALSNW
jgi:hypothetical protein